MKNCFLVVRHSERIDESHPKEWEAIIRATYSKSEGSSGRIISKGAITTKGSSQPRGTTLLPQIPLIRRGSGSTTGTTPRTINPSPRTHSLKPSSIVTSSSSSSSSSRPPPLLPLRNQQHFSSDPPLSTRNGPLYAQQAAQTISTLIESIQRESSSSITSIKLYSSRLRRAVQTAFPIAQRLGTPIHLSYGLSTIINAVKKTKGSFEFQPMVELTEEFPGVTFISCDEAADVEHYLPVNHWIDSLHCLLQRSLSSELVIVVGHRETIRGIAGEHVNTPYCAIALFDRAPAAAPAASEEDLPPRPLPAKKGTIAQKMKSKTSTKQRDGPLYPLQQLFDPQGRSLNS